MPTTAVRMYIYMLYLVRNYVRVHHSHLGSGLCVSIDFGFRVPHTLYDIGNNTCLLKYSFQIIRRSAFFVIRLLTIRFTHGYTGGGRFDGRIDDDDGIMKPKRLQSMLAAYHTASNFQPTKTREKVVVSLEQALSMSSP